MWQLKKLSTNEALNEPQPLPENWGPIFGLAGVQERLADLSWLGPDYVDQGWFQLTLSEEIKIDIKNFLTESAPMVDTSNTAFTKGQLIAWIEYRRLLNEIPLQVGFPHTIIWPAKPQ